MTLPPPPPAVDRQVVRTTLIVLSLAALFALAWMLRSVLVLLFAAVLIAVILRAAADGLQKRAPLPTGIALALVIVAFLGLLAIVFWLFGAQINSQMAELIARLPRAYEQFKIRIGQPDLDRQLIIQLKAMAPDSGTIVSTVTTIVGGVAGTISALVLAIVGGIYLAAQPGLYRNGVLLLIPAKKRPDVDEAIELSGEALQRWLIAQLFAMAAVGLLSGLGLWAIGVPSPLALALIAGLFEFVPVAGPFLSAIPAVLLALTVGLNETLLTAGLYLLIQQIEGNVIMPIVQARSVDLPPALTLFSLVAFGLLFGIPGVLLATPLTVVAYVMVRKLYVTDALGEDLTPSGDVEASAKADEQAPGRGSHEA